MAGVPAGRLNIEIVAEVARLQQDLDKVKREVRSASGDIARNARAANDNLAGIGKGAGSNVVQFSREVARLKSAVDPAWGALQKYKSEVALLQQALREGAITHKQYVELLRNSVAGYRQAGDAVMQSTGQQRAGMQQLSMQLNDVATMWALGAPPMQIFASQAGQVIQALQLMAGGTSKFATFMMGPWGMALTTAAVVLVPFIGKLLESGNAADKAADAIKDLSHEFDFAKISAEELAKINELLADANKEVERTSIQAANATRIKAEEDRDAAKAALLRARAEYERIAAFSRDPTFAEGNTAYAGQLGNLDEKISSLTKSIDGFDEVARRSQFNVEILTAGLDANGRKAEELRARINDLRVAYQDSGNGKFLQEALNLQKQLDTLEKDKPSNSRKLTDEQKALKERNKDAEQFIKSLELEIARIGLNDRALRQLEASRAADAAATEKQKNRILELNKQREDALALDEARKAAKGLLDEAAGMGLTTEQAKEREAIAAAVKAADAAIMSSSKEVREELLAQSEAITRNLQKWKDRRDELAQVELTKLIDGLKAENKLMGLTGTAREKAALELEEVAFRAEWAARGLKDVDGAWEIYRQQKAANIDKAEELRRAADEAERLNSQFRELIGLLDRLGGMGSIFGSLLAIASGNYSSIAGGPFGDLLSFVLNQQTGWTTDKQGKEIPKLLGDELKDVFGKKGIFGQTLGDVLKGAGIGMAAGGIVAGKTYSTEEQIGAAIGGAAGNAIGTAIAGPIGGAIGSAVMGTLGSLIGGLFSGAKKGTVTVDGQSIIGTRFSSSAQLQAATDSANSLLSSLDKIATQLGGTLQSVAGVSIGMRNDSWRVDPTGQGRTKGAGVLDFGDDAEAAAMAAAKLLIERGVIGGIRASTQRLLQAGDDLETQLNKALAFEGVFKDLEASTSPLMASVKDLRAEFAQLNDIFVEAGATAEEFAKLQELQALRMQQLMDQAFSSYRSTFYTDDQQLALAKATINKRMAELGYGSVDTVGEYVQLVDSIDTTTDAGIELAGQLLELSDEFAVLKSAEEKAKQEAEAAAEAAKALAQQREQIAIDTLRALGRESEALARQRKMELEAAPESLRPLLKELYKAQDIAAARDELAAAYERESGALEDTIDRFGRLGDTLRDFRSSLTASGSGLASYAQALAKLKEVGRLASLGDETAMANLPGAGRDYLDVAKSTARSLQEYEEAVALVRRYTTGAIGAADAGVSVAEQQLAEMKNTVGALIDIDESVVSVQEAVDRLAALVAADPAGAGGSAAASNNQAQDEKQDRRQKRLEDRLDRMTERLNRFGDTQALMHKIFQRVEQAGALRMVQIEEPA